MNKNLFYYANKISEAWAGMQSEHSSSSSSSSSSYGGAEYESSDSSFDDSFSDSSDFDPQGDTPQYASDYAMMGEGLTLVLILVLTIVTLAAAWRLSGVVIGVYSFIRDMILLAIRVSVAAILAVVFLWWVCNDEVKRELHELAAAMNRAVLQQNLYEGIQRTFNRIINSKWIFF